MVAWGLAAPKAHGSLNLDETSAALVPGSGRLHGSRGSEACTAATWIDRGCHAQRAADELHARGSASACRQCFEAKGLRFFWWLTALGRSTCSFLLVLQRQCGMATHNRNDQSANRTILPKVTSLPPLSKDTCASAARRALILFVRSSSMPVRSSTPFRQSPSPSQ